MRDVAAVAGVSVKTVSRVVNQESGVSEELADRVSNAVSLLGYRHNLAASSLRRAGGKTATIGLLLEDVANPFSSALHRAIEDVARSRGIMVFAGSCDEDAARERDVLMALISRRVDGLIAVPASPDSSTLLSEPQRAGTPIVFVDRPITSGAADCVAVDNRGGSREGVRHLVAAGHRRIAFLGDAPSIWTAAERYAGYADALSWADLPVGRHLVRRNVRSSAEAEKATLSLLAQPDPPTALFTGQNLITMGAVKALQHRGLQHSVAVVGFDDFAVADLLDPAITVLAQDAPELGRLAAELLFRRLDGDAGPARHLMLPTSLIVRGSGEIRVR
jgi:LacI family transcriptional regulator